jgi:HTH-type transcriptional regulator/antitoxin HigA
MIKKTFQPDIAIHPGETLKEFLEKFDMTQTELAKRTGLTLKTVNEIVKGKNPITSETALKLASVFDTSAEFWNNLEKQYQETLARLELENNLEKEKQFLKNFSCYKKLVKLGFVKKTKDIKEKIKNLLSFFGVSSFDYIPEVQPIAFRKSKEDINEKALAAWLRIGEIEGKKAKTKKFNKKRLISKIPELKALSTKSPKKYGKKIKEILASCGIVVLYIPYFKNTSVYGATRWLTSDKALIQLSLLYKWEDIFWFSLFHEIGHIVKHGKRDQFLEFKDEAKIDNKKEDEADKFANKNLISEKELDKLKDPSLKSIKKLAKEINIAPSIIAGRIAHKASIKGNNKVWHDVAELRPRLNLENFTKLSLIEK